LIITGTSQDKLDKFVASLPKVEGGGKVFAYTLDLRDRKATEAFVEKTVEECPTVDILINNVS
jgi:NADP-dependent 3-hydroxy acid dehydrogenase YdfG